MCLLDQLFLLWRARSVKTLEWERAVKVGKHASCTVRYHWLTGEYLVSPGCVSPKDLILKSKPLPTQALAQLTHPSAALERGRAHLRSRPCSQHWRALWVMRTQGAESCRQGIEGGLFWPKKGQPRPPTQQKQLLFLSVPVVWQVLHICKKWANFFCNYE